MLAGKVLLMSRGDYDASTTYEVLDWVRYNHKSWVCKETSTGNAPENGQYWQELATDGRGIDRIEEEQSGTQHHFTMYYTEPLPDGSTTFEFDIYDGSGGGGGASSWSDLRNKPFNTLGADFKVVNNELQLQDTISVKATSATSATNATNATNASNLKKTDGTTVSADSITTKLSQLNNTSTDTDKVLTANGDGTTSWKVAKGEGGHDMLSTVSAVEAITSPTDDHVASAYVIKNYSNRYTNSVISTLTANQNEITITSDVFKNDNATFEFMFEPNANNEVITLAKYELDTTAGTIKITVVTAPTINTRIRVDVTDYRA